MNVFVTDFVFRRMSTKIYQHTVSGMTILSLSMCFYSARIHRSIQSGSLQRIFRKATFCFASFITSDILPVKSIYIGGQKPFFLFICVGPFTIFMSTSSPNGILGSKAVLALLRNDLGNEELESILKSQIPAASRSNRPTIYSHDVSRTQARDPRLLESSVRRGSGSCSRSPSPAA